MERGRNFLIVYLNSSLVAWVLLPLNAEGQPNRPNWIIELPGSSLTFCIGHSWPFLWFEINVHQSNVLLSKEGNSIDQFGSLSWGPVWTSLINIIISWKTHVQKRTSKEMFFFLKQQRGDSIMIIFRINNEKIFSDYYILN